MSERVRAAIDDFLSQKRIAVVGVSRNEREYNRGVFDELRKRGYDVVPVNPNAKEIGGAPCYESVRAISPPVDGVLVMTSRGMTEAVVRECNEAGVHRIWIGLGSDTPQAAEAGRQGGNAVIAGYCPYMFLPNAAWVHRLHGGLLKLVGQFPK
jgi:predicted CoA-binding protein